MSLTRVDSSKLKAATEGAKKKIEEAIALLEGYAPLLDEESRQTILRGRQNLGPTARLVAQIMSERPSLAKTAGYETSAVQEDLENLELIEPVIAPLERLFRMMQDARLQWNGELLEQTLTGYRAAKAQIMMTDDAKLKQDIERISDFFAIKRKAK